MAGEGKGAGSWPDLQLSLRDATARRPGTRYHTTCEIRHVLLTVFAGTRKLFFSRFTMAYTAH